MLTRPKRSNGRLVFIVVLLLAIGAGATLFFSKDEKPSIVTQNSNQQLDDKVNDEPKPEPTPEIEVPKTFQLDVPFTPQAPTANWDELHNEACEEASSIMAYAYFNNITSLPPAVVEREIDKLTTWQQDNYGYYLSITTEETAKMIRDVYDLKATVVDMDEEAIKKALLEDKLVILPAQGQMLNNPNFTPPGPPYHMLVITGWDETNFITNDPGTRRGENYKYTYETLYDSAGLWSHSSDELNTNIKEVIIVSK